MEYQKGSEIIKVYVARMRTLNLVANLPADQIWDYLVNGVRVEVRDFMRRTNKRALDHAPASVELCFEAITTAGMEVENDKVREAWTQAQHSIKVQIEAAAKGKGKAVEREPAKESKFGKKEAPREVKKDKNRVQKAKPASKSSNSSQASKADDKDRNCHG